MSTDHMTKKQWKERNGEIVTYQFGRPMSWEDFKRMPADIQKEYLLNLVRRYSTTASDLAKMFGITPVTVSKFCGTREIGIEFCRGKRMTKEQRAEFEKFLGQEDNTVQFVAPAQNPEPEQSSSNTRLSSCADMTGFSLCFEGAIHPEMVVNSIVSMLRPNANVRLEVRCSILPDLG